MRGSGARVEKSEVVPDLSDRADGRTRIAGGALLINGDGWREPVNGVNVGLLHLPEELTCVGREALDIATLTFGVDGVEGEARLA